MDKLKNEEAGYALYPVKEVKDLYLYKVKYELLLKELESLKKENWYLRQLLQRTK